jgi:hypothetical protein
MHARYPDVARGRRQDSIDADLFRLIEERRIVAVRTHRKLGVEAASQDVGFGPEFGRVFVSDTPKHSATRVGVWQKAKASGQKSIFTVSLMLWGLNADEFGVGRKMILGQHLKLRDGPFRAPGRCCFRGLSMRLVSLWWELPPWLTSNIRI